MPKTWDNQQKKKIVYFLVLVAIISEEPIRPFRKMTAKRSILAIVSLFRTQAKLYILIELLPIQNDLRRTMLKITT